MEACGSSRMPERDRDAYTPCSDAGPQDVQVRLCAVRSDPRLAVLLSRDELERSAQFTREVDRARFVMGAAMTRVLVGSQVGVAPWAVAIDRRCEHCGMPHGKPVAPHHPGVQVSVSHSGKWVVVASCTISVGVDVEEKHRVSPDLEDQMLSAGERARMASEGSDRASALAAVWVRKEAVLKALGVGLNVQMNAIEVSTSPPMRAHGPVIPPRQCVNVADIDVDDEHSCAVALLHDGAPRMVVPQVRTWTVGDLVK